MDQKHKRESKGAIYVDSQGNVTNIIDLGPEDYSVSAVSGASELFDVPPPASMLDEEKYVPRRLNVPLAFKQTYGMDIRFADPEHKRYSEFVDVLLKPSDAVAKKAEFEGILGDIRDTAGLHHAFSRIIPDIRKIMKSQDDPRWGMVKALSHRDDKIGETLVSALYKFGYAVKARKVRDFALSMGIRYDARELSACKMEGYSRYMKDYEGNRSSVITESVRNLCSRIARGARVDESDASGETLLSLFSVQLANIANYKTAARCLDVLFNEFENEAFDFDCAGRDGSSLEERVFRADDVYGDRALRMVKFLRSVWEMSQSPEETPAPAGGANSQVERVRSRIERAYCVRGGNGA